MKRSTVFVASLTASLYVSGPSLFAADGADQGPTGNSPPSNVIPLNSEDQDFINQVWSINQTEIQLGTVADEKASSGNVKHFGKQVVTDHTTLQAELTSLAAHRGALLPRIIGKSDHELIGRLAELNGAEFDKQYMTAMISGYKQAVAAVEKEAKDHPQTTFGEWAAQVLPKFKDHLAMARKVGKEVGATDEGVINAVPANDDGPKK